MASNDKEKKKNDFIDLFQTLWGIKKTFFKVWAVTFILSCIWIFPQPRTYNCTTTIAPETSEDTPGGSIASLASSFGLDIGGSGSDAIYPQIYPDLFESTEFLCELCDIKIKTTDDEIETDYFDYLKNHQKVNKLLFPVIWVKLKIKELTSEKATPVAGKDGKRFDPFRLTKETDLIFKVIQSNIKCTYSKTTDIVTISVTDQDPMVCALMCDSVKAHLQNYITEYRTKKARIDREHYRNLLAQATKEYKKALNDYSAYCDAHNNITMSAYKMRGNALENDMQQKLNIMNAMAARFEAAEAKVQEVTPAFTTIKNSTMPTKPSGPKRVFFILTMMILATMGTIACKLRKEIIEWF